jgi:hypothetical protein
MKEGFITQDYYAAVPFGKKQLIIIFNGQQLEVVNTELQAKKFIEAHRAASAGVGTVFVGNTNKPKSKRKSR